MRSEFVFPDWSNMNLEMSGALFAATKHLQETSEKIAAAVRMPEFVGIPPEAREQLFERLRSCIQTISSCMVPEDERDDPVIETVRDPGVVVNALVEIQKALLAKCEFYLHRRKSGAVTIVLDGARARLFVVEKPRPDVTGDIFDQVEAAGLSAVIPNDLVVESLPPSAEEPQK